MGFYVIKRILLFIPLLLGVITVAFILLKMIPGDPAIIIAGERSSWEDIEKIRRHLGGEGNIFREYIGYINLLLHGEFGRSYYTQRRISQDIMDKLPNTFMLAFFAMLIAVPAGVFTGFISGIKKDSMVDRFFSIISISGLSMPIFWLGLIIMLLFSLKLRLFPPSGSGGLRFIVLPAITLAIPASASIARVTRTLVGDTILMPYIKTAYSKGIPVRDIYMVHILKNISIPLITIIGIDFGSYLSGAVLTETIFGWDGIGRYTFEAILKRDFPAVIGSIIVTTSLFVFINTIVDILYHYLDPRVRFNAALR